MSLSQATTDKLKSTLKGFDITALIAAIVHADEQEFTVPEVSVLTTEELTTRDTNKVAEGKTEGFKAGKTEGLKITGKTIIKKLNLPDTTKEDDPDKIIEAINARDATGDAGLKEQITLLQKNKTDLEAEKLVLVKEKDALVLDTAIITDFPSNRDSNLSDGERLMIIKNSLSFEVVDGKQVVKKNGEILRDAATQNPIERKDAINSLFTERKWVGEAGDPGRGGGNQPAGGTGTPLKASDARATWLKQNPGGSEQSAECIQFISDAGTKAGDAFDWGN